MKYFGYLKTFNLADVLTKPDRLLTDVSNITLFMGHLEHDYNVDAVIEISLENLVHKGKIINMTSRGHAMTKVK